MPPESPEESLLDTVEELERAISEASRACAHCGRLPPVDAIRCAHCGAGLEVWSPPEAAEPKAFEGGGRQRPATALAPGAARDEIEGLVFGIESTVAKVAESSSTRERKRANAEIVSRSGERLGRILGHPRRARLWGTVAAGAVANLLAGPLPILGPQATLPRAGLMLLGTLLVALGVGLSGAPSRLEPALRADRSPCPLCGTQVAPTIAECPTCGALLQG